MSAACIDNYLGNLLRAHLIEDKTVVPKLFTQYGPLSTFSSRTDLAYVLGLIDAETRREINLVRKIRNEFAHRHEPTSFEFPSIRDQCREFLLSQKVDTPRKQFTLGVMFTLATLLTRTAGTTHCQPRRDVFTSPEAALKIWDDAHRDLDHVASVAVQELGINLEESKSET